MTTTRRLGLAVMLVFLLPVAVSAGEVRNREVHQQQRIGQGVSSGQLSAGEASRLESREGRINASRQGDLAANGGHLTRADYRNLNRRENAASAKIYSDKHNAVTQPGVAPQ